MKIYNEYKGPENYQHKIDLSKLSDFQINKIFKKRFKTIRKLNKFF